ncbi:hypothetical protein A3I35_01405 [Candidatus Falkowbacteria bacterium RIFCSPLOWO2_02_FULL_45_15]|uniref:Uncharacterized protein n=1 Tax=Candidatus Falkowbacteria bacterium RIFCSPLOWO2_02_FULL_45_15 TaxID=1797988 RepID=A0A1F5RZT6_9BACT|nr:MAG: hypothetical protein A3I35_01405 [Candidatus Falkowbacteria bacterium RIFCSPLOWO2_02_FULL_45_15]
MANHKPIKTAAAINPHTFRRGFTPAPKFLVSGRIPAVELPGVLEGVGIKLNAIPFIKVIRRLNARGQI